MKRVTKTPDTVPAILDVKSIHAGQRVALLSRMDFGTNAYRKPLIDTAKEILRTLEQPHFDILVGGLVSAKTLAKEMKAYVKERIPARLSPAERAAEKERLETEFLQNMANKIAKAIPEMTMPDPENLGGKKPVDFFITTSPAFDGVYGEAIAQMVSEIRPDVQVWHTGGDRFLIKYVDKIVWALTPQKAVWMRGDYYSTAVERVIKDKTKQTPQGSPDLYIVGCFASGINKPKGELPYSYVSIPALSRLEETRVSENQVGLAILEYLPGESQPLFRNYSLKDLIARELEFITPPEDATELQKHLIAIMKARGWPTPGIFKYYLRNDYHTDISKDEIVTELTALMQKKPTKNWSGIVQESGKKFCFNPAWLQDHLKYSINITKDSWNEDRIISFACLHGGSVETDYEFFVNELPKIILRRGATVLVAAGDIKEGTKHSLVMKGEVIAGMNNTVQEKFAGNLVGTVMFKVFVPRFTEALKDLGKKKPSAEEIRQMVSLSLMDLYYKAGNHDLWETEDGHDPLEIFHFTLLQFLTENIGTELGSLGLGGVSVRDLIEKNIQQKDIFELPSGLKVSIQHPHMSRTKTTSIRPQEMLVYAKRHDCQVAIGGNFHVSENVEEWDQDLGQCVCQEIGTIKHGSNFERNKMKTVDQGVGYLRILSRKEKILKGGKTVEEPRIFMTESAFYGAPRPCPRVNNLEIINMFVKELGVQQLTSFNKN